MLPSKTDSSERADSKALSAAGRRREQNRIAQRNHRARAREQREQEAQEQAGESRKPISPSQEAVRASPPANSHEPDFSELSPNLCNGTIKPQDLWSGAHSDLRLDSTVQALSELAVQCQCNGIFGPCAYHRESIRAESTMLSLNMMMSPDSMELFPQSSPPLSDMMPIPSIPPAPMGQPLQSAQLMEPQQQPILPRASPADSMTSRFEGILHHLEAVGFKTFDEAVATYYIHEFEPSSEPDMAQKVSRGRRLRRVLTEIEESSASWTFWEARGYREKIIEAAENICVSEIDHLHPRGSGFPPLAKSMLSPDRNGQGDYLSQVPNPMASTLSKVYQNESPNLWALLTSLAGHQSANCEAAALASLSLLASTHADPSAKVHHLMGNVAHHIAQADGQRSARSSIGSRTSSSQICTSSAGSISSTCSSRSDLCA